MAGNLRFSIPSNPKRPWPDLGQPQIVARSPGPEGSPGASNSIENLRSEFKHILTVRNGDVPYVRILYGGRFGSPPLFPRNADLFTTLIHDGTLLRQPTGSSKASGPTHVGHGTEYVGVLNRPISGLVEGARNESPHRTPTAGQDPRSTRA